MEKNEMTLENAKLESTVMNLMKSLEKYEKEFNVDGLLHQIEDLKQAKKQTNQ